MATAATFLVQVPAGAGPGSVLALTAPNGVQVQVQVPAGLATGATFAVGMPAAPVAVMAAPVVAQVAMQPVMMNPVGQPQQMGQPTMVAQPVGVGVPLVGAAQQSGGGMGLGLSMVNTHSVAPSSQYGVGARTTFEIERDLFHMGGVIAEAYGVDVPDKYIIREWMPTGEVRQTCALLRSVLSV